jgi:metal-responsive CopG/Arc/MetJ family transcriptional regulator
MTRVSVSLPDWLVKIIDTQRGDVPRSRYLFRLIQRINEYTTNTKEEKN